MKIWHLPALPPQSVNGVNATIWLIAKAQALLGHKVSLLLDEPADEATAAVAAQAGLELLYSPASGRRYDSAGELASLLKDDPPHVVHMHSVFIPKQAALAKDLGRHNIPYVVTPHGGIAPQVLQRGWLKKTLYSWFAEKPRFQAAAAISALTPVEEEQVRAFVPRYKGILRSVPNPVDTYGLGNHRWKGNTAAKHLVFLGRFDVLCKGLDILIDIARFMPDVHIHLYGVDDAKTKGWLERLQNSLPPNVHFHNPVYGAQKAQVLTDASLYIQTSRWDAWGVAIGEAMYLGVPCGITDTLAIAGLFRQFDLGLVIPPQPAQAAAYLVDVLKQPARLRQWSINAQAFAKQHTYPQRVASTYIALYEDILR